MSPAALFAAAAQVGLGNWWEAGAKVESSFDLKTLIAIEVATFAVLEGFRVKAYEKTGETGLGPFAPFDPLNMRSDETRLKELKNGRLAMVAFLGFSSQAAVQGLGPIECLQAHLADPGHNNSERGGCAGRAAPLLRCSCCCGRAAVAVPPHGLRCIMAGCCCIVLPRLAHFPTPLVPLSPLGLPGWCCSCAPHPAPSPIPTPLSLHLGGGQRGHRGGNRAGHHPHPDRGQERAGGH